MGNRFDPTDIGTPIPLIGLFEMLGIILIACAIIGVILWVT